MNATEINQMVKELTDDVDPATFIEEINQTELPPAVTAFVRRYEEEIDTRNAFVWKWIYDLFTHLTLETVPEKRFEELRTVKTLFTIFIVILDDLAEEDKDRATFEQVRTIPGPIDPLDTPEHVNQPALSIEEDLWGSISDRLSDLPRYDEFSQPLLYDTRQAINAMDYSLLVSDSPAVATRTGTRHYDPHNMILFAYTDMDLMATPSFERADLALLRELIWKAQYMARIGNWVTTWQREVYEGDFSSGVVVEALREGIVTPEQLRNDPTAAVEAIQDSSIVATLIERWYTLLADLQEIDETATSVDLDRVADRMSTVMAFHLASEGYK